ncbi:translation initiation factor eIF2B subunit delta [Drosophila montana]|uniref:translation initiation factor eIF2B subunit delta n=1 Tax=Drosophila montana TaxID=40370 RepID=UPI00313EBAC7
MVMTSEQNSSTSAANKQKKQRQRNRPRNKRNRLEDNEAQPSSDSAMQKSNSNPAADKTREQVMAEREAKKQAKLAKKQKPNTPATTIITQVEQTTITKKLTTTTTTTTKEQNQLQLAAAAPAPAFDDTVTSNAVQVTAQNSTDSLTNAAGAGEKTRDQIKAEREAKKAAKHAAKSNKANNVDDVAQQLNNVQITPKTAVTETAAAGASDQDKKKPALSKAERRAIQEAQRAAKVQGQNKKATPTTPGAAKAAAKSVKATPVVSATPVKEQKRESESPAKSPSKPTTHKAEREWNVKLFNHLVSADKDASLFINDASVHPSIARLGVQYAQRTIVGSNARCIAFLHALRQVVQDFETPAKKEFGRSLDAAVKHHVEHLHKCRPLAVSVSNAYKQFKNQLTQLPDTPETELKELLGHFIDTYIENQIGKAAQAISSSMQEKITDGDVLLTFACSSLIQFICEEAQRRQVSFRVIVVDSWPFCEGQEMLRRLHACGIPCTYVLINAISYVMPEATKVMLGAHALLANGYVMARTGTAQVALVANSHNVPVLVCCETHKFSERFQTDAIVYNELCDPNQLVKNGKCCLHNWQTKNRLTPLNLSYDITPPELVSAVVTEVAILPCTSVPVILRIKPDIGY